MCHVTLRSHGNSISSVSSGETGHAECPGKTSVFPKFPGIVWYEIAIHFISKKRGGGQEAGLRAERALEGWLLGDALGAGVDQLDADGWVFGPGGDEAPAHQVEVMPTSFGEDVYRRVVGEGVQ